MSLKISLSKVCLIPECFLECRSEWLTNLGSDWPEEDQEVPREGGTTHLWEESWDDDDTSEDFSKQLKFVSGIVEEKLLD